MNAAKCHHYLKALNIPLWLEKEKVPVVQRQTVELGPSVKDPVDLISLLEKGTIQRLDNHPEAGLLVLELSENADGVLEPTFLATECQQLLSAMLLSIDQNLSAVGYGVIRLTTNIQAKSEPLPTTKSHVLLLLNDNELVRLGFQIGQVYNLGETTCVACWHPKSLLETPLKKRQSWTVLQSLKRLL